MVKKSHKDSVGWNACLFVFFLTLINGSASTNKEGYYGKYIGKLSQLHHGVSGDVFAVDARTLHLRNFNYDGEGPAAYFYAGNSKAPGGNGFRLRDERGTTNVLPKYRNKHITITFPEGKTLQNVRWFSVWCDEFSVNFGDIKIPKNLDFPKPQKISGLSGVHGVSSEPIVIVDAQTLLIPSFSYDGEAPDAKFWVGQGLKPSPQGIRIPDENGKEQPLRRYDRKTIVLTLPGDLTIFDIGHFGVWCEAFTVDFGHVQIPRGLNIPPSLKMLGVSPQSKLNCEVLWDDFAYEVRWAVAGDSIVLQLVARLENNEYMSFGLSGDRSRSRMVGGDVVVVWVDKESLKGYAKDYYLDAKSQCSGGRGSCPDENIEAGAESVRLLNAALVNGYSIVTFQRSLKAQDDFDQEVFTNTSQPIIWAVGPLNSRKEVSYHSLVNRGDIFIDFGRAPKWNCPTPESVSDHSEPEISSLSREYEEARIQSAKIQDSSRRDSRPKSQIPTPASVPKTSAWEIPPIKCYEPEDGVFYAQMGPTGGKHGYSAITGHVGWGISWYINGLLIPEINVVRGRTYTFIVEGGLDPETPARYHPFYITDDPIGGYQYKTPQERTNIQIFAGAVQNKRGEVRPTGIGRLCNWTPDPNAPPADEFTSFGAYQRTLRLECDPGNPGIIQWTVEKETPDTVYYQCYTHRHLGWKINVHDHCEGEAASNLVPSIAKPPTPSIKPYEVDSEGSESVNLETRVKLDAETAKNISEKYQTNFGANELVSYGASSKYFPQFYEEELKGSRNDFGVRTAIIRPQIVPQVPSQNFQYPYADNSIQQQKLNIPQSPFVLENVFGKFFASTLPSKLSGYSVTEETLEENTKEQNFHIVPITYTQTSQSVDGLQNHQNLKGGEPSYVSERTKNENKFQEEYFKDHETARTEEKLKRYNQKLTYHSRLPSDPNRLRKPPSSNPLTLQQRPLPPAVFRPPFSPKPQKRPLNLGPHKTGHLVQTKFPHSHQRVHVALDAKEDFNKQETQLLRQIKRPNKKQPNPSFSIHDLSHSSVVSQPFFLNTPFAENNGFDPQSIQVEGGFKPILNTGIAPKLPSTLIDKADTEIAENADDMVGVIDLFTSDTSNKKKFFIRGTQENSTTEKNASENEESKDEEVDLFKNQKLQTFEPVFIPSYPDESIKKFQEKFKKKPLLRSKPRYDEFQHYNLQNGGQVYVKIRPSVNVVRRPLYPDNVVPPFKISHQRGTPQPRFQEPNDSDEGNFATGIKYISNHTSIRNFKAENILGVLEMYEDKSNKSEAYNITASKDFISKDISKNDEIDQDEIAMANEKKDFYLPPKADEFRSYDGKVIKAIEAPILPEESPFTDISKLPQFVPFKGAVPPLSLSVSPKNLPQLRMSKLARHDILPPSNSSVESVILKVSSHFQNYKTQERKKRSPDHLPGHGEHDHHHHHHNQHNGGSCGPSNLWQTALISFTLTCLQRQSVFNFFNIRDYI